MIYLDNAATSYPKPNCVVNRVTRTIAEAGGNPGRSGHRLSLAAADFVYHSRATVANFLHTKREESIIFTLNATYALNIALRARARNGSHILISDMEHNSVWRPVCRMKQDGLITYSIFSHKGNVCNNIRAAITPDTDIVVCTHVSNVTGFVFPIADIATLCREKNIYFIVDASQSIGHRAIDLTKIDCDALCAPGHKGLFGIQGSGLLYLRDATDLQDVFQGGSGADSLTPYMPSYLPDRFEAGTLATPAIASVSAGIEWIQEQTLSKIETCEVNFSKRLHGYCAEIENITLYSKPQTGIIAFAIHNVHSEKVAQELDDVGICVRGGLHCAPLAHQTLGTISNGLVRLSASAFNSLGEAEIAAYHIKRIAAKYK